LNKYGLILLIWFCYFIRGNFGISRYLWSDPCILLSYLLWQGRIQN